MNKEKKAASCTSFPEFMLLLQPAAFFDSLSDRAHFCVRSLSVSKNYVFDTLGGCLKGCRGKECASVGVYRYGKRRTTQKAKALAPPGPTVFWINKEKKAAPCSSFSEFMLLLRPAAFFDSLKPPADTGNGVCGGLSVIGKCGARVQRVARAMEAISPTPFSTAGGR